jgi:hypothetical protein
MLRTLDIAAEPRPTKKLPVEFRIPGHNGKLFGVADDVSLGGVFIETPWPASFGQEVMVTLSRPGTAGLVHVPGTVRWTGQNGMGVQFGPLGARETHAIVEIEHDLTRP